MENGQPEDAFQVVFLIHGVHRNARRLVKWAGKYSSSRRKNILFVAPEFSDSKLEASAALSLGNICSSARLETMNDQKDWTLSYIPTIFSSLAAEYSVAEKYSMFGHSAGAQFAHRFALFGDTRHAKNVVVANAGWYTTIDTDKKFPYGLGENAPPHDIKQTLAVNLTVLLGLRDIDVDDNFRTTARAYEQGATRLERGTYFYKTAKQYAVANNLPFNWKLKRVNGVGHKSIRMLKAALPYLLEG